MSFEQGADPHVDHITVRVALLDSFVQAANVVVCEVSGFAPIKGRRHGHDRGVQRIFIYFVRFATPTRIFRVTRTLDTERLMERLRSAPGELTLFCLQAVLFVR